ncbi:calcium-binding protein [Streptomyces katsurahamanus]|uniref:Calcium-binding protein n=2 Tax=Streptomyces katsurahamanus TaxID=2577098 RepID=A0ABW9P0N8_9ACTN|nr:calcium-binding protein [Streptomyces katsurahamanus]
MRLTPRCPLRTGKYMRTRATVAVATGALALTALAVPAAQADEQPSEKALRSALAAPFAAAPAGNGTFSSVSVNGGKPVVLGVSAVKTFNLTFKASDRDRVYDALPMLWRGGTADKPDFAYLTESKDGTAACGQATTVTCKAKFTINPEHLFLNDAAGTHNVALASVDFNGSITRKDKAKTFFLQRASKLSVDAAPEPVEKGESLTVKGTLSRANWETLTYQGYTNQPVKLQFRKSGSKTYTTLKTVTTDSKGKLSTTVKATSDGVYRYSFAGTTTTQAMNAVGDTVDVK